MGTDRNLKAIYMTAVLKEQSRNRKLLPVVQNADNAIYWKNLENDTNPLDIWFIWWVVVFDVWTTGARLLNYVFDIMVRRKDGFWLDKQFFSHFKNLVRASVWVKPICARKFLTWFFSEYVFAYYKIFYKPFTRIPELHSKHPDLRTNMSSQTQRVKSCGDR